MIMILNEYDAVETRAGCTKTAEELGLTPFFAESNELFIDLDKSYMGLETGLPLLLNEKVLKVMIANGIHMQSFFATRSKSGNTHVYVCVDRSLDSTEAALLQMALGSDPVRETVTITEAKLQLSVRNSGRS